MFIPFLVKISLIYLLDTLFLTVLFFLFYPLLAISEWFLYLPFVLLLTFFLLKRSIVLDGWHQTGRPKIGVPLWKYFWGCRVTGPVTDILVLLFSLSFSSFLFFKTIWFDAKTGQTLIAGKLWSDFGAHIPLIKSFSTGFNFPPQYPLFPGEPIRYHFLFDFQIAILEKLGLPLSFAINVPSILSFSALLLLIYSVTVLLFNKKLVGFLAVILTLFNSSFAFLSLPQKIPYTGNFLSWFSQIIHNRQFLAFGPYDQGIVTGFWNLNIYTNQRHFAFALALFFLIIYLFLTKAVTDKKILFLIGTVIGFLPIVHSGVFLIAILSLPLFFLLIRLENPKTSFLSYLSNLGYLIIPLVLFSLPQLLYMQGTPSPLTEAGIKFRPGYLTFVNFNWLSFLKFWVLNLGLTLFLAPLGFLLAPKRSRFLFLFALLPFLVGNLFSFSPDMATNHKFFNFSVIILNIYTAYFVSSLLSLRGPRFNRGTKQSSSLIRLPRPSLRSGLAMTVGIVLLFFLTLSGFLDFFPTINDTYFGLPDQRQKEDIAWIEQNTNSRAIFANSYWLYHPASLAGRRIVLGWPYFSWSAGYDTNFRDKMQRELYAANNMTRTCQLIRNLRVDYVTISTQIKDESTSFNLQFWQKNFPLVYKNPQSGFFVFKDNCPVLK